MDAMVSSPLPAVVAAPSAPQSGGPAQHETDPRFAQALDDARRDARPENAGEQPARGRAAGRDDQRAQDAVAAADGTSRPDAGTTPDATPSDGATAAEGAAPASKAPFDPIPDAPLDLAAWLPGWSPTSPHAVEQAGRGAEAGPVRAAAMRSGGGTRVCAPQADEPSGPADAARAGQHEDKRLAVTLDPAATVAAAAQRAAQPTSPSHASVAPPLIAATSLAAPHVTAQATAPAQAHVAAHVESPAFAPAIGAQISVFAREGVQQAQLQLHPAELGPVAVQIALDGTAAHVEFHAAHAATRAALESSLPELAAALRDAGFTLSGGGVFEQRQGRGDAPRQASPGRGPASRDEDSVVASAPSRAAPRGVLDLYV